MIIGRYAVTPSDIRYASWSFNSEVAFYLFCIYISNEDGEQVLEQWTAKMDDVNKWLKLADDAIHDYEDRRTNAFERWREEDD